MQSGGPQQSYMTKTMARFKKEPLIPIGLAAVVAVLTRGIVAFTRGDRAGSFRMMRYRVIFQSGVAFVLLFGVFFRPDGSPSPQARTGASVDKSYIMDVGVEYRVEDGKAVYGEGKPQPISDGERR